MGIIPRWHKFSKREIRPWAISGVCPVLLALAGCTHQPTTHQEMEVEFQAEFGFPPPPEVDKYKCSVVSVGDSLGTWMSSDTGSRFPGYMLFHIRVNFPE